MSTKNPKLVEVCILKTIGKKNHIYDDFFTQRQMEFVCVLNGKETKMKKIAIIYTNLTKFVDIAAKKKTHFVLSVRNLTGWKESIFSNELIEFVGNSLMMRTTMEL